MAASKVVVVGLSVAGGVAILFLVAVLLYLYVPRKASEPDEVPACSATPRVDGATGQVTDFNQVLMPDGTCGENVAVLNKLCLQTVCTDTDKCKSTDSYVTYDAYNAETHTCVKVADPSCEQQLCDTPYCKSPSIRPLVLPPLHKRTSALGACINPGELEVAAMCNALSDHQYVSPDCRMVQMESVIETKLLPDTPNTTTLITGIMVVPRKNTDDAADPLQFSFSMAGAGGTYTGMLTTTPPVNTSLCSDASSMCRTFTIDFLPGTVRAGTYTLTLFGRPTWSAVNTMQSVQPVTVKLTAPPTDKNVYPQLNVVPLRKVAGDLIHDGITLRQLLSPLPYMYEGVAMTIPPSLTVQDLRTVDATDNTGAGTANAFYMAACDPTICPLIGGSSKLMPYALVFIAWLPVQALATTTCKSSDITYTVRKESAKNGASLVSPALPTAFADLVQVGDHVKYTITTNQGTCKSQPVVLSIFIPPFSDSICHSVPITGSVLPPWMWQSNSGCVWYPDDSGAKDYYCAFEYANPQHSLLNSSGKVKLMISDGNNQCKEVLPSFPKLTTPYPSTSPDMPSYCNFEDHLADVCFTGYASSTLRQATCSPALPLGSVGSGDSISNEGAFYDRLNRIITFYGLHNTWPNTSVDAIAGDKLQKALYHNQYYNCGVESNKHRWGITKSGCPEGDEACLQAVTNAACDAEDRNICQPWKPLKGSAGVFEQARVCFGDEAFTSSKCCSPGQKYQFDTRIAKESAHASRGSCVASS